MGHAALIGGGGTSYLVSIKAYSSEGIIPAAGVKGRLAVVTTLAIPSWASGGIMMKSAKPTTRDDGSQLQNGDICVIEGYASNTAFEVVKGVTVYPIACFQYSSGAWAERVAKFDNGTSWIYLYLFLYYLGDKCISVTDGWQARAMQSTSSQVAVTPTVVEGQDYTQISLGAGTNRSGVYEVLRDVNLEPFTTLRFNGFGNAGGANFVRLIIALRQSTYFISNAISNTGITLTSRGDIDVDISAINTTADVMIGLYTGGTSGAPSATMYSTKLIQ